jgi:prepilin-type N-terminal cleavage/methylation domain-containing protein
METNSLLRRVRETHRDLWLPVVRCTHSTDVRSPRRRPPAAFTLVELLVVITIIAMLAGLGTAAAIMVRDRARKTVTALGLKDLEQACQRYKAIYGEYPPDFALINDATYGTAARAIVTRHFAKAFPRYSGNWVTDLPTALGIPISQLTPQTALAIFLGGIPDPASNNAPSGFAADPTNPFQTVAACPSRTTVFCEFDRTRLRNFMYWPKDATGDMTRGAIVYFRAENGNYTLDGTVAGTQKSATDSDAGATVVYPAYDLRIGATAWVNPESIQILSSGADLAYGSTGGPLQYPNGANYRPETFDNITNFSSGTLDESKP